MLTIVLWGGVGIFFLLLDLVKSKTVKQSRRWQRSVRKEIHLIDVGEISWNPNTFAIYGSSLL